MGRNSQRSYYAVQKGVKPGIYSTWKECQSNVIGYSGAKHKKFNTLEEAQAFVNQSSSVSQVKDAYVPPRPPKRAHDQIKEEPSMPSNKALKTETTTWNKALKTETATLNKALKTETATLNKALKTETAALNKALKTETTTSPTKVVYTDGASRGNGQPGARAGYGVWWGDGDARNMSAALDGEKQTNQRAEATAILKVLEQTQHMPEKLEIRTDSRYCVQAMTEWHKNWKKKDWKSSTGGKVQNRDLFEPMLKLVDSRKGKTAFIYVPGHKGFYGNEQADALAVAGAESSARVKKEEH